MSDSNQEGKRTHSESAGVSERTAKTGTHRRAIHRERIPEDIVATAEVPRLLLVDDDPIFGRIMSRLAEQSRVQLTYCRSLEEIGEKAWWQFQAAIVDFDLGTSTGIELISQLEKILGPLPVILVSQGHQVDVAPNRWPTSIKGFIHKSLGHVAILEAAVAAHELAQEQTIAGALRPPVKPKH